MASDKEFVDFVLDQIEIDAKITAKSMFGEYGLFADKKIFALICDNKLFVKPTMAGRAFIKDVVEAPPYTGAKPSLLIDNRMEDRKWLSGLVRVSIKELPEPRPRKKKSKNR
ncbi:MAG: TfoX/Sxy family protein [Chlorobi bacterium]|nr:TfoX/Sxy family protein [Chlorobiota bacterium]